MCVTTGGTVWGGGSIRWMRRIVGHIYEEIISLENLLVAWEEFVVGKNKRADVQLFSRALLHNIQLLHRDLTSFTYKHASYEQFEITDPKQRLISKASVRDRLLHHAIYRVLYPLFDPTFIYDSYSCRINKGTHRAFQRLVVLTRKASRNYTKPCFALKCDIRKFFDSVDHEVLVGLLKERIEDERVLNLLRSIIDSFVVVPGKGIPIGNLVSQLFVNVYLDPLDKFVRHRLRAKSYLRYADDFLLLSQNPDELMGYFVEINQFVKTVLKLTIHPHKIYLRKLSQGIDFVGYVAFPHYNLPRRKTVKRILKNIRRVAYRATGETTI